MMIVSDKARRPPNWPERQPGALRASGISVVGRDFKSELHKQFLRSAALQRMLAAKDSSPAPAPTSWFRRPIRRTNCSPKTSRLPHRRVRARRGARYAVAWAPMTSLRPPMLPAARSRLYWRMKASCHLPLRRNAARTQALRCGRQIHSSPGTDGACARRGRARPSWRMTSPTAPTNLDTPTNEAKTKFKLASDFKAKPGSLPRLRYGQTYSLRARICDLAGNSVSDPDAPSFAADVPEQTPPFGYGRYEPVSPPAVLQRAAPVRRRIVWSAWWSVHPRSAAPTRRPTAIIPPKSFAARSPSGSTACLMLRCRRSREDGTGRS